MKMRLSQKELQNMTSDEQQFAQQLFALADATQPKPVFSQKLASELYAAHPATRRQKFTIIHRRWSALAAALLVVVLGLVFASPLTSLAQDIVDSFFNRAADSETFDEPQSISRDELSPTPMPAQPVYILQSFEDAQGDAPFQIKVPAYLPDGYSLMDASYDAVANHTSLFFTSNGIGLSLVQTPLESADSFDIGASAVVTEVQIGSTVGEFMEGTWLAITETNDDDISFEGREWDSDYPFQQLIWTDGEFRYWMSSVLGQPNDLPLTEWVRLAESLQ